MACAATVDNTTTASSDTYGPNLANNTQLITTTIMAPAGKPAVFRSPIATWFLREMSVRHPSLTL